MQSYESMPDIERLSIIAASIMLAFALTLLVSFPAQLFNFSILGILVEFFLDFSTVISVLTALLAAVGMEWLIQSHPHNEKYQTNWEHFRHWIVPVLTTLVIGIALNTFTGGLIWWAIFVFGSLLLLAVFVAEYNVVAVETASHPLATIGLTGLSFALYLLLAITVFSTDARLYIRLPLLGLGALMVISRTLFLRLGRWHIVWALVNSIIISQVVVGFHYLPLSPTQFGLILVGIVYALTSVFTAIEESRRYLAFWAEPVSMILLMVVASLIWG